MNNTQKNYRNASAIAVLLFVMLLLLSTSVYARPITDVFSGSLIRINNFFENREYEPYATAIDFFLFSILFIAIYMVGARYAFKEVKKPEQVIVILLGLITAFLLVLAEFSITLLLPYMNWIVYLLLFFLFLWLLKGIPSKIWRFLLALLIVLLLIGLFQWLFNFGSFRFCDLKYFNWLIFILTFIIWLFVFRKAIKNVFWRLVVALLLALLIVFVLQKICGYISLPEVSGIEAPQVPSSLPSVSYPEGIAGFFAQSWDYVKDFFGSFKGINFGGLQPGVPDWLRGSTDSLRQVPGQQYSAPSDSTALQPVFGSEQPQGQETGKKEAQQKEAEEKKTETKIVPFKDGVMPVSEAPTQPTGQPSQATTTPTTTTQPRGGEGEEKGGIVGTGYSWAWLLLLGVPVLLKFKGPRKLLTKPIKSVWNKVKGSKKPSAIAEKSRAELIELYNSIIKSALKKQELLRDAHVKEAYLKRIAEKDAPELYFDKNRALIKKTEGRLQELLHAERDLLENLQKLRDQQVELFKRLPEFRNALQNLPEIKRREGEEIWNRIRTSIDHRRAA